MLISVVVPAYNEEKNLETIINKVQNLKFPDGFDFEIIIVNDCSKDKTLEIAKKLSEEFPKIKVLNNEKNMGKSQTVKKGILSTVGDWVVIQDADLEYEPEDFVFMLEQAIRFNCDVAYGNRFGMANDVIYAKNFIGNLLLSFLSNLFTVLRIKVNIPDMEVCYKLVRGDIMREIGATIVSKSNFGLEPEITAKLCHYKIDNKPLKFIILPIRYYPRSVAEGKKMKAFRDGFKALIEILRFNIFSK